MTPEQRDLLQRLEAEGDTPETRARMRDALGLDRRTFNKRVARARGARQRLQQAAEDFAALDEGVQSQLHRAGLTSVAGVRGGWVFPTDADGNKVASIRFEGAREQEETTEDLAERIKDALSQIPPVDPVPPPLHAEGELLGLVPIADLHVGMMAWGRETGEDWSTQAACERLVKWSGEVIRRMPRCGICALLFNGDTLHADDQRNVTPVSKHQLDVDTRHFRSIDMAVTATAIAIDTALQWHGQVIVAIKPGNHDQHSHLALLFAMGQRYRLEPRVTVLREPSEFWCYEFGSVLLMAHHGHRAKPEQIVMNLAHEYAEAWGRTKYRYLWTGHLHHMKAADIGGVQWEQSRAMTARDAYAAAHGYPSRAELQGVVYHIEKGEIARARVAA